MTMREETTSSLGGDFSFHFSLHREVPSRFQYALQQVDLTGCEVSASLRGHHSEVLHLGMRRRGDNPDVGIILLYPTKLVHPLVSVRSLKAPSKARGCLERALQELRKPESDYSEVSKELEQAVSIYPEYAAAWQLLGECRSKAGDRSGARQAFEEAMAADPEYVPPYLHLAGLDLAENRWKRVSDYSQKALELDDSITKAQYYLAVARFSLGDSETAEKWALKVESTADAYRYPMNYYVLGAIRTQRGDLQNAAPAFRRFLELKPNAKSAPQIKTLLEQWERQGLVEASVGHRP